MSVRLSRDPRVAPRRIVPILPSAAPHRRVARGVTPGTASMRLARAFERIGARLKIQPPRASSRDGFTGPRLQLAVDVDRDGAFFSLRADPDRVASLRVLDVREDERSLLLHAAASASGSPRARTVLVSVAPRHDVRWMPDHPRARDVRSARQLARPSPI